VQFLCDIQSRVRDQQYASDSKSLAKAIDEFNYVNITLEIQQIENRKRAENAEERSRKTTALRRLRRTHSAEELERLQ
jgi:hypothetical protein